MLLNGRFNIVRLRTINKLYSKDLPIHSYYHFEKISSKHQENEKGELST